MSVCKTKTYFPPEQKTDTTAQLGKSSSSPRAASVFENTTKVVFPRGTSYVNTEEL
jgi:hypothetical protein